MTGTNVACAPWFSRGQCRHGGALGTDWWDVTHVIAKANSHPHENLMDGQQAVTGRAAWVGRVGNTEVLMESLYTQGLGGYGDVKCSCSSWVATIQRKFDCMGQD